MSWYRLLPTAAQEAVLRDHCGHARYAWNPAEPVASHGYSARAWLNREPPLLLPSA